MQQSWRLMHKMMMAISSGLSRQSLADHGTIILAEGRNEVKVLWDTGEETWEPMQEMRKFDP